MSCGWVRWAVAGREQQLHESHGSHSLHGTASQHWMVLRLQRPRFSEASRMARGVTSGTSRCVGSAATVSLSASMHARPGCPADCGCGCSSWSCGGGQLCRYGANPLLRVHAKHSAGRLTLSHSHRTLTLTSY